MTEDSVVPTAMISEDLDKTSVITRKFLGSIQNDSVIFFGNLCIFFRVGRDKALP